MVRRKGMHMLLQVCLLRLGCEVLPVRVGRVERIGSSCCHVLLRLRFLRLGCQTLPLWIWRVALLGLR